MRGTSFHYYIKSIEDIIKKAIGNSFIEHLNKLRTERERLLHQIWNLEYISEEEKEEINVRRLIDFDVIFYNLIGNVHRKLQSEILLEIADTSLKFSEFENAAFTYNYLLKRLYKYLTRNALPDIHHKLAQALFWKNLLPSAKRHFSRSLNLYEEINNPVGIARAKNGLAIVSVEEGKLKEGENLILEAMEILKNLQTPPTESKVLRANILMNQGNLYHMRGEFKKAISQYKEAHKYVKDLETTELTTGLLFYNMAIAYKTLEQPEKAEELLQKALEVAEEIKNRNLKALALSLKAEILAYGGKFSEAHATAITAFTIFNQINNKANIADVYRILGMIKREEGDYDMSLSFLNTSSRINEECKKFFNLAETYIELAKLYKRMGEQKQFDHYVGLAKRQYKKIGAIKRIEALRNI